MFKNRFVVNEKKKAIRHKRIIEKQNDQRDGKVDRSALHVNVKLSLLVNYFHLTYFSLSLKVFPNDKGVKNSSMGAWSEQKNSCEK